MLAKGAKMGGATVLEGVTVTGFVKNGREVTGVVTDQGDIDPLAKNATFSHIAPGYLEVTSGH